MRVTGFSAFIKKRDPGLWAALASSTIWGMLPLYWRMLQDVSPYLILCHRIVWSCVFLFPLVIGTGRMPEVMKAAKSAATLRGLFCSSIILGCNWLIFIWAVNKDMVLETSLGYYINPLFTICMGVLLFKDRPSPMRWLAIAIAAAGVSAEVVLTGTFPWVALSLAVLFALYVLLRKIAPVEALPGLALETFILAPFALAFILWTEFNQPNAAAWGASMQELLLLMGTGVTTSVPLVLYAYGARHLPFTTLGVLQYISPTCTFLIGLFVFGETFTTGRAVSFTAIWVALTIYTVDSLRNRQPQTCRTKPVTPESSGSE